MSTPRKPDLDQLIGALTADGSPGELGGRDAALGEFRAAGQRAAAVPRRSRAAGRRPGALPARLAAFGAALLVAASAAAAYAQALPDPVQRLAHTVFAPLGVPDGQHQTGSSPGTVPVSGTAGITAATSASPRAAGGYRVTVAASRARVADGGAVVITGRVTEHGAQAAGVTVRLYARPVGSARFTLVATGATGPLGGFRLPSPALTASTVFRVAGPDGAHSAAVKVAVAPRIAASADGGAEPPAPTE